MTHRFPEQKIPEPEPGDSGREGIRGAHRVARDRPSLDIAARPPLPDHPQHMAADIEDEENDPVIDTGPGIADGPRPRG